MDSMVTRLARNGMDGVIEMKIKQITKRTEKVVFDSLIGGQTFSYGSAYKDGVDRGTKLRFSHLGNVNPTIELELTMLETRQLMDILQKRVAEFESRIAESLEKASLPNIEF